MNKENFNTTLRNLLKNKAMTSTDLRDAILEKYPEENINTIKSMILRSRLLRSSAPMKINRGRYAYTLKANRNHEELFLKLSNNDIDGIKFIKKILDESYAFVSLFTFKKILQIHPDNTDLLERKLEALKFYKNSIYAKDDLIFQLQK